MDDAAQPEVGDGLQLPSWPLLTRRCMVRTFRHTDVDPALEYLGDPTVMAFIEPCFDRDQVVAFLDAAGAGPAPLVHAVEDRSSGHLLGHVIFHPWGSPATWEVGWLLRRDVWGQGLASELTAALIVSGFRTPGIERIVGECAPANRASIRVMEKAGMVRAPELDGDLPVWAIHRP